MASTVNGQASITLDSQRELSGIEQHGYLRPLHGELIRARVFIDSNTAFVVDDPTVANQFSSSGQRIFLVGVQYAMDIAHTLRFESQVGSNSAITIGGPYKLAAENGISERATEGVICSTDQSGKLLISVDTATALNPFEGVLLYQIANKVIVPARTGAL